MGFYIVCSLVAAMNPSDLDAMDENVPFTKATLDNLLGVKHNQEMYRHYFNCFIEAQRNREIESPVDRIKRIRTGMTITKSFLQLLSRMIWNLSDSSRQPCYVMQSVRRADNWRGCVLRHFKSSPFFLSPSSFVYMYFIIVQNLPLFCLL